MDKEIKKYHNDRDELLMKICKKANIDYNRLVEKEIPQSTLFMCEVINYMHKKLMHLPEGVWKTALDVGPLSFSGTALLSTIHRAGSFNRLKLKVSAVDITDKYVLLKEVMAPEVEFIKGDIFNLNRKWDIVIASHVIEHVPDPVKFVQRLQELARDIVIIACPWREKPLVTPGHVNTIDKEFTMKIGARDLHIYTNYSWGKDREVCIFWLPGNA